MEKSNNNNNNNDNNDRIMHSNKLFKDRGPEYEVRREHRVSMQTNRIIYYILGVVEFLLIMRLLLKMLGANTGNFLVSLLYSATGSLIAPFSDIFNIFSSRNADVQFIFEPSVIIAIIIYAAAARGFIGLIRIGSYRDT